MTKKIFRSTVAVGLAVLAASLVIIMSALYSYFGKLQEQQLKDELSIAAAAMAEGDGMSYLTRLDSDNYRITWLRADGVVLYDTRADAATMDAQVAEMDAMFRPHAREVGERVVDIYTRKHTSPFMAEMSRSMEWWFKNWLGK